MAGLLWSVQARAHDFWIEPSTFHPLPGQTIMVSLRVGQEFIGDAVPYLSGQIDRFFVRQDGSDETLTGSEGLDPAGYLRASGDATAIIAYVSSGSSVELPPDRFEAYLEQYGLDEIIEDRKRRHEEAIPGKECFYRYAKALLTGAKPAPSASQPLPLKYEIIPDDDPTAGTGAFHARVLYEGAPLANALVRAFLKEDPSVQASARSDAQGAFSLNLPRSDVWLIASVHMVRTSFFSSLFSAKECDWESAWASLTFERP